MDIFMIFLTFFGLVCIILGVQFLYWAVWMVGSGLFFSIAFSFLMIGVLVGQYVISEW